MLTEYFVGGKVISFQENTRLVYLGGHSINYDSTFHIDSSCTSRTIFEFINPDVGWRKWETQLPVPVTNATFIKLESDFCDMKQAEEITSPFPYNMTDFSHEDCATETNSTYLREFYYAHG